MTLNMILGRIITLLVRRVWFNDLASRSQAAFDEYLQRRGFDPATITEEQVESLLQE